MISRPDIIKGIYLRLTASRFGYPSGLIGTAERVNEFGTLAGGI